MKRVISTKVDGATNTCGIPAAPAVNEVVEPSYVEIAEEYDKYYSKDKSSNIAGCNLSERGIRRCQKRN